MITKLGMVILLEHDLDAAVEFYTKIGIKPVFHIKESWAEFAIESVKLGLCPTSQKPTDRITGIVLEVDDVRKFYEQFKDEIPFKSEPQAKVHGIMVSMQDPGGNILDLYQPTPERVQKLVKDVVDREKKEGGESAAVQGHGCCGRADCGCTVEQADA